MPVRGHGWYKRPYRIIGTAPDGRKVHLAYHWRGARNDSLTQMRHMGYDVRAENRGPEVVRDAVSGSPAPRDKELDR